MTPRTVSTSLREVASLVSIASRLAEHPPSGLLRGAVSRATVAAYQLAATEAESEMAHADKIAGLQSFVDFAAAVEPIHGPFRSNMIDAALAAEVDARVARGAPFHGRRLRGWMDPLASARPRTRPAGPAAGTAVVPALPHPVTRACAEAEALDDVDVVLLRTLELTRALRIAATRGDPRRALLDSYEATALGLCVRPAESGVDDARWLLMHTWTLLRRRRPLAAAVIRARVRWTRKAHLPSHGGPA